jgi:hypothetical protein
MTDRDPSSFTVEELSDPTIPAAVLGQIAASRPDLWPAILGHPNTYPELRAYIIQQLPGAESAPLVAEPPVQPPAQPPAGYAPGGYAPAGPEVPPTAYGQAGYGPTGAGPAGYAPGGPGEGQAWQQQYAPAGPGGPSGPAGPMVGSAIQAWKSASPLTKTLQIAFPALGVIGFICLFLPAVSASVLGYSESTSFFSAGDGPILLILLLAVIALGVVRLLTPKRWATLATVVVSILTGLMTVFEFIDVASDIGDLNGEFGGWGAQASMGAGLVLLFIIGLALIAAAITTLLTSKR